MLRKASIPVLRQQIDRIDDQLLRLLSRRAELALAIAEQKARSNSEVYAPAREKGVLERLARANRGPLPAHLVRAVFREIISASRSLEQRLRIAYLGPEATFTHLAACQQFGAAADYLAAASVADVFHEVESERADLGVVPVENSTEGMVAHTLDLLADSPLQICAEISLAVRHNLLARAGTSMKGIDRIVAHPQALAQCRRWLAEHLPAVPTEAEASNARAAERARAEEGTAAIAGEAAAETYGLTVLSRAINDEPGNLTRFVVLAARDAARPTGDDKTSILFSVRDEVGILARMLKPFAAHGIDLIKIDSNENTLGPSPKAVAAITAALGDLHRYPDGSAFYLKRRLAERLGVSEAEVIVGNGSNEIIELAVRTFLRPGDEAVMADQAFVVYRLVVQSAGGSSRMVPLRDFTHDLEAIAAAVTPRTRLVFLGNPNNPTGTIVRRAAWRAFLGRLPEHLLVVADDAYAEYVEDPEYPDTIRERGDGRVAVLSLRTFSKLYGLAGLRVGYGVASGPVIDALDRIRQPFNVNALALAGALAALDDEEHVRRTLATNRAGMAFLVEAFRTLGLAHVPSAANFILVRVGGGARVYEALLRRGVIVRPMAVYGFPEHVRVTVGTEAENARFVAALRAVLA